MTEAKPPDLNDAGGPHAGKVEPLTNAAIRSGVPPPMGTIATSRWGSKPLRLSAVKVM